MSETKETPAQIVRRARGDKTIDAFAAELGTSRQRVIDWEKGRSFPSERYAAMLAIHADVTIADLARPTSPTIEEAMHGLAETYARLQEEVAKTRGEAAAAQLDPSDRTLLRRIRAAVGEVAETQAAILGELSAIRTRLEQLEGSPSATQSARPRRKRPA